MSATTGSWVLGYLEGDAVVTVTTAGVMTPALFTRMVREALAYAQARGCRKFLLDHRNMVPEISTVTIYKLPETLDRLGVPRDVRVASVYAADSPAKGDFEFFGNVAHNRGMPHRMFLDPESAMKWLKT